VTYPIYSHHHADHIGTRVAVRPRRGAGRLGGQQAAADARQRPDPAGPDLTFDPRDTLRVGGERIRLAWRGTNHTADNIYIHLPSQDTLLLVDIVLPGWVPFSNLNLSEDIPASIAAPAKALSSPWRHYIGGHLGRLGTRDDISVHHQDLADNARTALATVDPTPYFTRYGNNAWAAGTTYLEAVADDAAAPVITNYPGVLAAADVFAASNGFIMLESIRLDLGDGSPIHPDAMKQQGGVSERVPGLDLGGHVALGPWRVRRAGYGAMQLASDEGFGAAPGIAKRSNPAGLRRLRAGARIARIR
jgi:hypothetical protein